MPVLCPQCQSSNIETLDYAKKTGGVIGAVSGATNGVAGALRGAKLGGTIGCVAGPLGRSLGQIAGALLGGLIGATTGALAGASLGELVDKHILDNERCRDCGCTFSPRPPESLAGSSAPTAESTAETSATTLFDFAHFLSASS